MEPHQRSVQQVFGERAAHYTTSAAHSDADVLAHLVALDPTEREKLGLCDVDGTLHMNHWYVTAHATKSWRAGS